MQDFSRRRPVREKWNTLSFLKTICIVLIGLWGSFNTILTFRKARWSYTIGWIIAAIILRDLLDPIVLVVNIAVPLIILVYRGWKLFRP